MKIFLNGMHVTMQHDWHCALEDLQDINRLQSESGGGHSPPLKNIYGNTGDMIKMANLKSEYPKILTTMRLDPRLRDALAAAAVSLSQSSSALTARILTDWLKDKRFL